MGERSKFRDRSPVSELTGVLAFLGPEGSWTHQAVLDLCAAEDDASSATLTLHAADWTELQAGWEQARFDVICLPVATSLVGSTPYLESLLAWRDASIIHRHARQLGYCLMAAGAQALQEIHTVYAHPVALQEASNWLDRTMPWVHRVAVSSNGAGAQRVARLMARGYAALGAPLGAKVHGLEVLVQGIEKGPHNVTVWWVMGRTTEALNAVNSKSACMVWIPDASATNIGDAQSQWASLEQSPDVRIAVNGGWVQCLDSDEEKMHAASTRFLGSAALSWA